MPRALVVVVLVLCSPLPTLAQAPTLPVGARVRVESTVANGTRKTTGTVMRVSADSLVLAAFDAVERPIALASLTSVQISRGRSRTKGAQRGFLIAAGVVGGMALLTTGAAGEPGNGAFIVIVGLPVYGTVGALIGAAIGRERWETVRR